MRGEHPEMTPYLLQNFVPIPETGCWLWLGKWDCCGYGMISKRGNMFSAHRSFFRHFVGPITQGPSLCHKCDVPACVNPDHLFLGSHADNMRDASRKGRFSNRGKNRGKGKRNRQWRATSRTNV